MHIAVLGHEIVIAEVVVLPLHAPPALSASAHPPGQALPVVGTAFNVLHLVPIGVPNLVSLAIESQQPSKPFPASTLKQTLVAGSASGTGAAILAPSCFSTPICSKVLQLSTPLRTRQELNAFFITFNFL